MSWGPRENTYPEHYWTTGPHNLNQTSGLMNRTILTQAAIVAVALTAGSAASAQSVGVGSTATIVTPITAAATAPLAFGSITKGSTTSVPATSASAAAVTLSGDQADNVIVSIPASVVISTSSGSGGNLNVTIDRGTLRKNTSNAQGSATQLNASSGSATVALSVDNQGDAVNNDGLGQVYLWIGGSVTPDDTQQRGSYSGTFTVSAAYSN